MALHCGFISILFVLCFPRQCLLQMIFPENVDDIFDSMLPDIDKKLNEITLRYMPSSTVPTMRGGLRVNKEKLSLNNETESSSNSEAISTTPTDMDFEKAKERVKMQEFEYFMNNSNSPLVSFHADTDEIEELNQMVDKITGQTKIKTRRQFMYAGDSVWRRQANKFPLGLTGKQIKMNSYNFNYYDENLLDYLKAKDKTIEVMLQVIYSARYRMPYPQLLRKRFSHDVKYRLGYCFSLLRHVKLQQMYIYNAFTNKMYRFETWLPVVKVYEKIVRFHVDIEDIIRLIKQLDAQRKQKEFDDYYYYFPKSTGTAAWRRKMDYDHTVPFS